MKRRAQGWRCVVLAVLIFGPAVAGSRARGDEDPPRPAPNSPDEPLAERASLVKAAAFLDAVSVSWTRERKCGTCHTNYAYLIARPVVDAGDLSATREVRTFFEERVAHWDDAEPKAKPRWDTEVVATAATLALNDAQTTKQLHPLTRRALDRMWTLQRADGAWDWLKCGWPPYEHDDYYGAAFAALAVGSAPDRYRETEAARRGLEKLRAFFHANPPPSLHHRAMLLWASTSVDGLLAADERQQAIDALFSAQRPDGGWSLPSLGDWKRRNGAPNDPDAPSDGFGTGFAIFVLRQAGIAEKDPRIGRGIDWLLRHQRVSGRWFTRSVNNDKAHYITHAGTGFAVLALRACGVTEP